MAKSHNFSYSNYNHGLGKAESGRVLANLPLVPYRRFRQVAIHGILCFRSWSTRTPQDKVRPTYRLYPPQALSKGREGLTPPALSARR